VLRMTIRAKLLAGFGAILALLGIVAAVATFGMSEMDARSNEIVDRRLPALF